MLKLFSKIWLVNFLLAGLVIFFGIRAYEVWSEGEKGPNEPRAIKKASSRAEREIHRISIPQESTYEVIAANNLFWPDRSEHEQKKVKHKSRNGPKIDKKLLRRLQAALKQINVYGVIITDGHKKALVTDLQKKAVQRGGPRRKGVFRRGTRWIKVGDRLGEFRVNDIMEKSVLLAAAGNKYQVFIYDKEKPKRRGAVKKQLGPRVIMTGWRVGSVQGTGGTEQKQRQPKPEVSKKKKSPKPTAKARKIPSKKKQGPTKREGR